MWRRFWVGTMKNRLTNEESVIGALLIDPEPVFPIIKENLIAEDFGDPFCRKVFTTVEAMMETGGTVDYVTLADRLGENSEATLREFMNLTPTARNVKAYCELVKKQSGQRQIRDILREAEKEIGENREPAEIMEELTDRLNNIRDVNGRISRIRTSADAAASFFNLFCETRNNPGGNSVRTEFKDLDAKLGGGMLKGGMYVVGARPGMGKTTFGVNLAEQIAKRGDAVLFFSLEMTEEQIMAKRLAIETGWSYTNLITAQLAEDYIPQMNNTLEMMAERPFYMVTDSPGTVKDIKSQCYQVKDLKCVIIDYLGLMHTEDDNSFKSRYELTTQISADLKKLAKRLKIPVIVLCQLNRENMATKDKRPNLQYLRDSGAIEQDADCVILLHRPKYYDEGETDYFGMEDIEIIVAKNRHAGTGTVKMMWEGMNGRITQITGTGGVRS